MICAGWMKGVKFDPIALLKLVGVLDYEDEANDVLNIIMDAAREDSSSVLDDLSDPEIRAYKSGIQNAAAPLKDDGEELQPEQLFFLRARCKNVLESKDLTSAQKDAITNKLIPDVPVVCELFERHATKLIEAIVLNDEEKADLECFICQQLLQVAEVADLNEEGSRRHFAHVMKEVLSSLQTPEDLVEGCTKALRLVRDTESNWFDDICEIVSNIDKPEADGQENGSESDDDELEPMRLVRIIAVLNVVLETASSQLSSHPAMKRFTKLVLSAVKHHNPMVQEVAIGCFGKLGLFTDENTLISTYKPVLLEVASAEEARIETRAQALLALADWSMLFSETLTPCNVNNEMLCFSSIVREVMDDSRMSAVCIAAEVAAKLLFAGRVCESEWFAKLITIFFDPRISDMKDTGADIKEEGDPVRLQQLLTLFFPAICLKDQGDSRDAMIGCILPLLDLIYLKAPAKMTANGKRSRKKVTWPVAKMIHYVCSTVDTGRPGGEDDATVVQTNKNEEGEDPRNTTAFVSVAPTVAADLSSTSLLASLSIAEFLVKNVEESLNTTDTRALCKLLGAADFDENEEETKNLFALKRLMEELGMILTDETSLKYIADLNDILSEINVDDETEEGDDDDEGEKPTGRCSLMSAGGGSDDEGGDASDDDKARSAAGLNLSEDLLKSFDDLKITDSDDEFGLDKENCTNAKRRRGKTSKSRNSAGSAASRRSRTRRFADAN